MINAHTKSSNAKRVLAFGVEYPIDLQGGVTVLCRALIEDLSLDYGIVLISPDSPGEFAKSTVAGHVMRHLHWDPIGTSVKKARSLAARLHATGAEIAHFHFGGNYGWGSRLLGATPIPYVTHRGIRVFSTVHQLISIVDGFCDPKKPLAWKLALLPAAWLAKMNLLVNVEREIAVSQQDLRLLRRWYRPLRRKFTQIYHSRVGTVASASATTQRERLILNVGHIADRKGQPHLVRAFARFSQQNPDWKLALVGHFAEQHSEAAIRATIREHRLGDRVILAGPQPDPTPWLLRASIYVQPSLEESLGLALQEAMFHGCACIGTRTGGIPELILDDTGVLVPAGDVEALHQAMSRLSVDAALRARLERNAASSLRSRGMTRQAMTNAHRSLYEGARS